MVIVHREPACPDRTLSCSCVAGLRFFSRSLWHADCWQHAVPTRRNHRTRPRPPVDTDVPELSPTALSGPARVGDVIWASTIEPQTNAPVTASTPVVGDTTIYAVFPIVSLPAGSQLIASWYFNDTSLDALNSAMRIDQDRTSGWIEFHIERTGTDPWPDGVYEIVLTDGTNELQRADITIS